MFCCALVSGYCMTSYGVPCAVAMILCMSDRSLHLVYLMAGWFLICQCHHSSYFHGIHEHCKGIASVFTKTQLPSAGRRVLMRNGWFRNIASYNGFPVGLVIFLGMAVVSAVLFFTTQNQDVTSFALVPTKRQSAFPVLIQRNGKCLHM